MAPPERIFGANICFDCDRACGGCSWTEVDPETGKLRWEPVSGWTAEKTYVSMQSTSHGKHQKILTETYHITACPQFARTPPRAIKEVKTINIPGVCIQCGAPLLSARGMAKFCSPACFREYKREERRIAKENEEIKKINREEEDARSRKFEGIPVSAFEAKTGKIVRYTSMREASNAAGCSSKTLSKICKMKKLHNGIYWRRECDIEDCRN